MSTMFLILVLLIVHSNANAAWESGAWGDCSATCDGTKTRVNTCVDDASDTPDCSALDEPETTTQAGCNDNACPCVCAGTWSDGDNDATACHADQTGCTNCDEDATSNWCEKKYATCEGPETVHASFGTTPGYFYCVPEVDALDASRGFLIGIVVAIAFMAY